MSMIRRLWDRHAILIACASLVVPLDVAVALRAVR